MASLLDRMRVARWFVARPSLYAEFARYVGHRLRAVGIDRKQEARDAAAACESMHVEPMTALERVIGHSVPPFSEVFGDAIVEGERRLRALPYKLHGAGNLDLIYHLSEYVEATRAIETGVSAGWSSLAFLCSLQNRRGSRLVSTDMPYPGSINETANSAGCVVPDGLRGLWQLHLAPDRTALPRALSQVPVIDICHYDSDKSYDGRMWSYRLLWKALREGGVFISDDIDDNFAFFHFCGEVQHQPVVVKVEASKGFKYIGFIIKRARERSNSL